MADEATRAVYFHLTNIPASAAKPLELYVDSTLIFNSEEPMPADQECVIEAQLPIPKISEYHNIYVRTVIKEKELDVLSKVNLTTFGEYIRISLADDGKKVVYKQRNDGDFEGAGTNVMTLEDETKAQELPADYAFKRKNMSGLVSTAVPVQGDSIMSSPTGMSSIFFHLANIPASEGEPFTVTCEGKILILLKESTPLNKVILKRVEVPEPKIASNHVVNLTIKILALGMDAKQPFDLTDKGHHIMVGVLNNGENCIIQQRKDEKFDSLPWQKPAAAASASPSKGPVSNKASAPQQISFYIQGIDATMIKPFRLYINKKEIFKCVTPVTGNQVKLVQYDAPRANMNEDLIVNVGFVIPKMFFTEISEQEFNITENGAHIKFTVTEETKGKFNIDMQQQHEPYTGASSVKEERLNKLNDLVNAKMAQNDGVQREVISSSHSQTVVQQAPKLVSSPAKPAVAATPAATPAPAASKPAASSGGLGSVLEDIEKLAALRDRGILTDAEFQAKKKQLLGL